MQRSSSRQKPEIFARLKAVAAVLVLLLLPATLFQNCAPYAGAFNPLYDAESTTGCMGTSCAVDAGSAMILVATGKSYFKKATTPNPVCDATSCIDVSGWCDTGGLPGSQFYTQWSYLGNNLSNIPKKESGVHCDDNGRFRIQVRIPNGFIYDVAKDYTLTVIMYPIDVEGIERNDINSANIGTISVSTSEK